MTTHLGSWLVAPKQRVGDVVRLERCVTAARAAGLPMGVARDLVRDAALLGVRDAVAAGRASGAVVLSDAAASDLVWGLEKAWEGADHG